MAIFKCKICGGTLEIEGAATVATCEYCGTKQTVPRLDDERRVNLYDRANHFLRNNDFDKAMGIYENILSEDSTDAEAYWSIVLCRYGVEYVDDPATHKHVPTVNRAQFTSIFDDEDYKSAIENADAYQRELYEAEAATINEIQKGFLAISQKEEPFDVFICYKETDAHGRRTQDSVLATELYHELTREGFKVFFSRITLEDKLGVAYEPYIFAALHSAKVMVVLGTRAEHFNAVWVKNEWSRYLALIKNGAKKTLIPAYRDMDPYDLPEEFSHLQAQDMSKLGFMQDLTRGIKKIADAGAPKATVKQSVAVTKETTPPAPLSVAPYIKRIFLFLEDGDWESANEYCEKVLDIDPENAQAYLGKLMAELEVEKQDDLKDCAEPFDEDKNYQKAVRFADASLKKTLTGYIEYINARNENERLESLYQEAISLMEDAEDEDDYLEAAQAFEEIAEYKDAAMLANECIADAEKAREIAEVKRKDEVYDDALLLMDRPVEYYERFSTKHYEDAVKAFESIRGWQDSEEKITFCRQRIAELKKQAEEARKEAEERDRRTLKITAIAILIICAVAAFAIILNTVIIPSSQYNNAVALMNAGKYAEAIVAFEELDGYKDSADKILECRYDEAVVLMNDGKYTEAIAAFRALDGYKDSVDKILECRYNEAVVLMNAGEYVEAIVAFKALNGYKDSDQKANALLVQYKTDALKSAKTGEYVFFGMYEQDNNIANGKEDVEWLVLEIKDGKMLLISKYALDCQAYNTIDKSITWETCTLRQWLNNDFLNAAFSAEEKAMIPTVTVSADPNPDYSTNPGNATQDQMFLLSITEANKYFALNRKCKATAYATARGVTADSNGYCAWLLRTPGSYTYRVTYVYPNGSVYELGSNVGNGNRGIRPAMWIDLSIVQ